MTTKLSQLPGPLSVGKECAYIIKNRPTIKKYNSVISLLIKERIFPSLYPASTTHKEWVSLLTRYGMQNIGIYAYINILCLLIRGNLNLFTLSVIPNDKDEANLSYIYRKNYFKCGDKVRVQISQQHYMSGEVIGPSDTQDYHYNIAQASGKYLYVSAPFWLIIKKHEN